MRPAMTALVVAIAGMMFPAMARWEDNNLKPLNSEPTFLLKQLIVVYLF